MPSLFLLLGSNVPEKRHLITDAIKEVIVIIGAVRKLSSIYETEPWGFEANETFYNQVIQVETTLKPTVVMQKCLEIEAQMGRIREAHKYVSRSIDIDILFYDEEIISTSSLEVPHPRIQQRRFALEPMNELAPHYIHPVFRKEIHQLLAECKDTCWVKRV